MGENVSFQDLNPRPLYRGCPNCLPARLKAEDECSNSGQENSSIVLEVEPSPKGTSIHSASLYGCHIEDAPTLEDKEEAHGKQPLDRNKSSGCSTT